MKIAFIAERMILGFGVDLVIDNVAESLAELGHEVTVFAINIDGSYGDRKYKIKRIPCPLIWNPIKQELVAHKVLPYIKNLENEFDVFIIETFPFFQYAAFLNKPTIVVEYGVPSTMQMNWKTKIRLGYEDLTKNFLYYKFVDGLIPISNYLKSKLTLDCKNKAEVIYCGCDHYFKNKSENQKFLNVAFRKKIGIKKDEKLLLYVGRLNYKNQPYKGVNDLLDIYNLAKRKNKKLRLLMVGYGDKNDEEYLKSKGALVVTKAPHEIMPTIYSSCDICVTASKWEGFDLPIAEANSFGKPAVCYDIGPHKEVIEDGVSGYVVKDKEEFIDKILEVSGDDEKYEKLSKGAFENAKKFQWKNIVAQYDKAIVRIVKNSKKTKAPTYVEGQVDLITLNFNGKKYLEPLFESIRKQTYKKIETVMVDNGSSDNSVEYVKKEFNWVKVLPQKTNLFFPKANNIAINATNGEYLLLLNNDTVLDKNAVEEMVRSIKKDPQIAAVSPKMMFYKNKKVFDAFGTLIMPDGSPFNRGIGQYDIGQYDAEEDIFGVCFGAVLIKRSVYENVVGPLDNDYFGYFEDVDWCYRAHGMGFKIMTCPKAIVYHDHSGTSKNFGYEWKYFLIQRNYIRTLVKNYGIKHLIKYGGKKILGLIKHYHNPPFYARKITVAKILLNTLYYSPKLFLKRLIVRSKRINGITDEYLWSFSVGELPYFNAEKYEPEYTIENIKHSYMEKYNRLSSLKINNKEKNNARKTLIRLNNLVSNYRIFEDTERQNLVDFIEQDLIRDLGKEDGMKYASKLRDL